MPSKYFLVLRNRNQQPHPEEFVPLDWPSYTSEPVFLEGSQVASYVPPAQYPVPPWELMKETDLLILKGNLAGAYGDMQAQKARRDALEEAANQQAATVDALAEPVADKTVMGIAESPDIDAKIQAAVDAALAARGLGTPPTP